MGSGASRTRKYRFSERNQCEQDTAKLAESAPEVDELPSCVTVRGLPAPADSRSNGTTRSVSEPLFSAQSFAVATGAPHLDNVCTANLLSLAEKLGYSSEIAFTPHSRFQRAQLEEYIIAQLGTRQTNDWAYEQREDVIETLDVLELLKRVMSLCQSLSASISSDQHCLESSLRSELSAAFPNAQACDNWTSELIEIADRSFAVQTILSDAQVELTRVQDKLEQGRQDITYVPLGSFEDLRLRINSLLTSLASVTLSLAIADGKDSSLDGAVDSDVRSSHEISATEDAQYESMTSWIALTHRSIDRLEEEAERAMTHRTARSQDVSSTVPRLDLTRAAAAPPAPSQQSLASQGRPEATQAGASNAGRRNKENRRSSRHQLRGASCDADAGDKNEPRQGPKKDGTKLVNGQAVVDGSTVFMCKGS